jgi:Spy/CpxP family protein refolding chaperone
LTATALLVSAATPALAQQHQHGQEQESGTMGPQSMMMQCMSAMMGMEGMQGMMGMEGMEGMEGMQDMGGKMMGRGMMGMMRTQPAMLLRASEALGLTPEQTEQLTALRDRAQPEHERHMQAAMQAHRTAAAILEGDGPDLSAYAAALNEAADHMVMAHVAMTRTALEGRAILTPEQLEKLEKLHEGMSGMHGG